MVFKLIMINHTNHLMIKWVSTHILLQKLLPPNLGHTYNVDPHKAPHSLSDIIRRHGHDIALVRGRASQAC